MKAIFSAFIGLALLTVPGCNRNQKGGEVKPLGPISVEVAHVSTRQVQRVMEAVGSMFPFEEVVISAEIEGRVDEVNVDLGDRVSEGQVLVRLSDEEQRYVLAQNEAQLRQSLERLGLKDEEDRVKDVRDAAEVRRVQAELSELEIRQKRVQELVDQGIGSRQELDQVQARFKSVQAEYDATINQARNLIQEVERYKAHVQFQRKKLRDTTIRAPFSASVKERTVTVGEYVRPNGPLITLVKTDPVRLRLEVPEHMAPWVKEGQLVQVNVEAFPGRQFAGKIWRISPTVEQSKRTFVVEALIPNPSAELKPGFYAKASIPTSKIERVQTVPVEAVNYVLGSSKVYVLDGDTIQAREVKLGDRFDQSVEILEGVSPGESVATSQVNRLDTGTKVKIISAAALPASPLQASN